MECVDLFGGKSLYNILGSDAPGLELLRSNGLDKVDSKEGSGLTSGLTSGLKRTPIPAGPPTDSYAYVTLGLPFDLGVTHAHWIGSWNHLFSPLVRNPFNLYCRHCVLPALALLMEESGPLKESAHSRKLCLTRALKGHATSIFVRCKAGLGMR